MKESIILSLLLLLSLSDWAKASNVSANDSVCIIEGTIKNIPDGCDVILYGSAGKYSGKQKTITQIKKGKFRFEKKVTGNEIYRIYLYPCVSNTKIYIDPNTKKTTIIGEGTTPSLWIAVNNNFEQQEQNLYNTYKKEKLAELVALDNSRDSITIKIGIATTQSERQALSDERNKISQTITEWNHKYCNTMLELMENRPYSQVFASELVLVLKKAKRVEKTFAESLTEKVRQLLNKVPVTEYTNDDISYVRRTLKLENAQLTNVIPNEDNEYRKNITTTAEKQGWCAFFDHKRSYEVDDHTEIYIIETSASNGALILSNQTGKIIPSGCPVILHTYNEMTDGTYSITLTEKNVTDIPSYTRWNLLDVSTADEKIKAWRLGFSAKEKKIALYPWETNNAESSIVYLRMPNSFTDMPIKVTQASGMWEIGTAHKKNKFRFMRNKPSDRKDTIDFDMTIPNSNDLKNVYLCGQPLLFDKENEYLCPITITDSIFLSLKAYGMPEAYAGAIKNNVWNKSKCVSLDVEGNNMFNHPLFSKGSNNSLFILDERRMNDMPIYTLNEITNHNSIDNIADYTKWKKHDMTWLNEFWLMSSSYYPMVDSSFLALGRISQNHDHFMSVINYKDKTCTPLNFLPDDGIKTDSIVKQHVYAANARIYGNGKEHYLYVCAKERFAFFFTINESEVNVVKYLYTTYPYYKTQDHLNPITYRIHHKELKCSANKKHIYSLLTERDKYGNRQNLTADVTLYGNTIEIYDWDGRKQKKHIIMDHSGESIMVSDDGKTLYLFCNDYSEGDSNQEIWVYDISNLDANEHNKPIHTEWNHAKETSESNSTENKKAGITTKKVKEGDMMVDFELYDYADKPHHLNEFLNKGKYTILEFSSLNCGPCRMVKPLLEKFYNKYNDRFEMITIPQDSKNIWKKKLDGTVSWHEWNDHKSAREISLKYGVNAIPTFIIISPNGKVEKKCLGTADFIEALKSYISAEELDNLLNSK